MEYKMDTGLVIFDLDGTLLNTIGDLAVACNAVLAMRGLPQHTYDEYCHFVGNGIMRLVERALPEELRTPYTVAAVRADFVEYYTEHIDVYTKPYEGIPELVAEIVRRGVRIAVASNKFQTGTEKLIRLFFLGVEFAAVFGQREGVPLKPDPAVVGEILALTGVAKERVLYVGDSGVDMQTAAAAGVRSVGVTWGFRERTSSRRPGRGTSSTIRPRYWSCYSPGAAVVRQSGSFCRFFSIYAEYVNIPGKLHDSGKKDIYLFPNSNIWRRTTIPSVTGMLPNSVC